MKKSKLLIFTFICLIVLSMFGSVVSLAWFSTNDFLQIDSFDISFKTEDNLLISTSKDGKYVTSLETEDLNKTSSFLPVSSMFSNNWLSEKAKNPTFIGRYESNASTLNKDDSDHPYVEPRVFNASDGYYSQEFYLKSTDSFYATLKADELSSYIKANEASNRVRAKQLYNSNDYSGYSEDEIYEELNRVAHAMRVSVLVDYKDKYQYHVYDPYKEEETSFGGLIDSDYRGYYDYKVDSETSKRYEVLYGDVKNRDKIVYSYNEHANLESNPTSLESGHAANTYIIDMDASISAGVEIAKEKSVSFAESESVKNDLLTGNEKEDTTEKLLLIPLDANQPTRIVISIYLEGWDKDCVNNTMGATFDCQLSFGLLDRTII